MDSFRLAATILFAAWGNIAAAATIDEVSLLDISEMDLYLEVDNHEDCESAPPYLQNANKALTAALATGAAADRAEAATYLNKYKTSSRWCPAGGLRYFGELVLMTRTALQEGILTQADVGTRDIRGTLGYAAQEAFNDISSGHLERAGKQMGCVAVCSYWDLSRSGVPHYSAYLDLFRADHGTEFASSAYDYVGTLAMVAHSIVINAIDTNKINALADFLIYNGTAAPHTYGTSWYSASTSDNWLALASMVFQCLADQDRKAKLKYVMTRRINYCRSHGYNMSIIGSCLYEGGWDYIESIEPSYDKSYYAQEMTCSADPDRNTAFLSEYYPGSSTYGPLTFYKNKFRVLMDVCSGGSGKNDDTIVGDIAAIEYDDAPYVQSIVGPQCEQEYHNIIKGAPVGGGGSFAYDSNHDSVTISGGGKTRTISCAYNKLTIRDNGVSYWHFPYLTSTGDITWDGGNIVNVKGLIFEYAGGIETPETMTPYTHSDGVVRQGYIAHRWTRITSKGAQVDIYPASAPWPILPLIYTIDSGDYNGDGTSDIAVFRPAPGLWSIRGITRLYFGAASDLPVSGDFNNDGTTEVAAFRKASGLWSVRGVTRLYFGSSDDIPVPGDYDGDGYCDLGVFRASEGLWSIRKVTRAYLGTAGDIPVPGSFGGGRKKGIAIFRPSSVLWSVRGLTRFYFGQSGDCPLTVAPGEGGPEGAAVFRGSDGLWSVRSVTRFYLGTGGDIPLSGDYGREPSHDPTIFRPASAYWAVKGRTRTTFGENGDYPVTGRPCRPVTPTPSPSPSATPSAIPTATATRVPTPSPTPSPAPTVPASFTPTPTPEGCKTPTPVPGPLSHI